MVNRDWIIEELLDFTRPGLYLAEADEKHRYVKRHLMLWQQLNWTTGLSEMSKECYRSKSQSSE